MKHISLLLCTVLLVLSFNVISGSEYIVLEQKSAEPILPSGVKSLGVQQSLISEEEIKESLDVTHEFSTFGGFVADLTDEEVELLKKDPRYTLVPNHKFSAHLDNSISQINANDSWNLRQNGTNLTGLHQTVCVIDTGVDYTHPNLGGCYGNNSASSDCVVLGGYDYSNSDDNPLDDHGHGTHVTGIITSNHSTYMGVAPDTKIIAIKSLDSGGNGNSATVAAGIDWCVNNASTFNISVITMSLGSDTYYNSHCNADFPTINTAVQAAVAANISVIISSGNCENTSVYECHEGISGPACLTGVIPVGAVNDSDDIWYQRGSLFQVLGPGRSIRSTANGGGTEVRSGTSMAAPHVAGLAVILTQFQKLQANNTLTNATLVSALNTTNVRLNDTTGNNNTYPRINFLTALYSLDFVSPAVTLQSPTNASSTTNQSFVFVLNATDFQVRNLTLNIWNNQGVLVNTTTNATQGDVIELTLNVTLSSTGEHRWGATAFDMNNNTFTTQNFTLTLNGSTLVNSPSNNTYTNESLTNFSCSATTPDTATLTNITFNLYNSTTLVNSTTRNISGQSNTTIFTHNFTAGDSYTFFCASYNNESTQTTSLNYTIHYDSLSPNVTVVDPLPTNVTSNSVSKTFYFNATDNHNNLTCNLSYGGSSVGSTSFSNYTLTQNVSRTFSSGNYTWKIVCQDIFGNTNETREHLLVITAEEESSSGGGGGGGGGGGSDDDSTSNLKGSQSNPYLKADLEDGFTYTFTRGKQIYLTDRFSQTHTITLNKITNRIAELTIESDPINITMESGDVVKLNLSNNGVYDILLNATTVTDSLAQIKIQEINEPHPDYVEPVLTIQEDQNETEEVTTPVEEESSFNRGPMQTMVAIVVFLILIFLGYKIYKTIRGRKDTINEVIIKKAKHEKKQERKGHKK